MSTAHAEVPGVRRRVKWDRPDIIAQLWQTYFEEARSLGKHWEGCHACPPEERDPEAQLDVHHVVDQQRIKEIARREKWPKVRLLRVLTDPRNSMLLCRGCHHLQTQRLRKLPLRAIRPYAWAFIRQHNFTDWVRRNYTGRHGPEEERHGRPHLDTEPGNSGP